MKTAENPRKNAQFTRRNIATVKKVVRKNGEYAV
jgi:hypothetical protein